MFFENTRLFEYLPKIIIPAITTTFKMLFISMILALIIGFLVAVILVLTSPKGLSPNKTIYNIFNFIVNMIRSFPVIILIVALTPLTRLIMGTSIGSAAAIVPLTIAAFPVVARLVESAFLEVSPSVVTAAKSFGANNFQIIFKVMLIEALPVIASGITFTTIQLLGNTALAGAVGAGGLGAVALTFGYERFDDAVMYTIVFILCIIVLIFQSIGNYIYTKLK
ncbi:MAG: methionine ABC transporter permease [Campylobacteraceae bacterium]